MQLCIYRHTHHAHSFVCVSACSYNVLVSGHMLYTYIQSISMPSRSRKLRRRHRETVGFGK